MTNKAWLAILTLIQGISTLSLVLEWRESSTFTVEHEDIVFAILLSAYFVVAQLEKLNMNIFLKMESNELKDDNDT